MKYPVLLFDIDSTLLDTPANETTALIKMSQDINFDLTPAKIQYYHDLNEDLWQKFESHQVERQYLLDNRFRLYFEHFGMHVDGPKYQQIYRGYFYHEYQLVTHAIELLQAMYPNHHLYIISNGTPAKQDTQLKGSHIDHFFDKVFLSETIGYAKPDKEFFETVEAQITDFNANDMLVIGDSLTADIAGANNAGLDSVWYNPHHDSINARFNPTYEVSDLLEIKEITK